MEGTSTAILQQRRSSELMNSSLPPTPTSSPSSQHKSIITPVSEGNNGALPPSPPMPRKPVSRQQSITRGTASSMAKAVRSNPIMGPTINTANTDNHSNISQRRFSVRNRKQSLTNMDTSRLLVTGSSADNLSVLSKRRSSWSPFTPVHNVDRKTPSPSQLSPDTLKKQQEEQQQSLDQSTNIPSSHPLATTKKATTTTEQGDTTSIKLSSSPTALTSSSSSASSSNSTRVHSSLSKKTSNAATTEPDFFKYDDNASPHAASLENNQQTHNIPLETPPPDDEEEVLNIRITSGPDQQQTATHHHHHHHHHYLHHNHSGGSDDDLPGYMRRPICAACNRNVKVTSSTESAAHLKSSASNSTNNSRRSSISASSTTAASAVALGGIAPTATAHMTKSKSAVSSSSTEGDSKTTAATMNENNSATFKLTTTRSHSPTSPIPTTQRIGERKKSILQDLSLKTGQLKAEEKEEHEDQVEKEKAVVMIHNNQKRQRRISDNSNGSKINVINEDRWNELLNQQKRLLEFINRDSASLPSSAALISNNQIDETNILETQMELLKRFEAFLMLTTVPITITTTTTTTPNAITTQTIKEPTIESTSLPITTWQTKVEFSITKFKWNMSQWFGTVVGTGNIEEQDFDALGYTKNVVISGVCVTTEPGLLPKNLQKYYRLHQEDTVICHKYLIHLTRENRLTAFATSKSWDKDEETNRCSFSVRGETHTKYCSVEFGAFHRRHHCRSCGHIFCQTHSSNCLPLFINNGEERGEWSRVCDSCFYARIEPQFIARS